jgi:hypothetical protein
MQWIHLGLSCYGLFGTKADHLYLSVFFVSAGVPNGEFPEISITKCRSRFYCTWFFSRAEDFESWRKGPSKSGKKMLPPEGNAETFNLRLALLQLAISHSLRARSCVLYRKMKVEYVTHTCEPSGGSIFFPDFEGPFRQLSKSSAHEKNQVQ